MRPKCPECGRVFDLTDPVDADELAYGHDCEVETDSEHEARMVSEGDAIADRWYDENGG